ncbi:unnamed protein product [Rotaria sp. Silwood1]|nr:unnamed protein product [Rotaria sp. Silwood1]
MKILAIEKEIKGVEWDSVENLLKDEAQAVYHLYLSNSLREIYFTENRSAVLVMETVDKNAAIKVLDTLPLTRNKIKVSLSSYDPKIIPGDFGTRELINNAAFIDQIKTPANASFKISICTGSLILVHGIASEEKQFTIDDVIDGIAKKLIHRHPHIYGDVRVNDDTDVKRNWEKIKQAEGKKSVLSGVPNSMNALPKAICIQEKAKKVGFEWENKEDVFKKVEEEINELQEAVASNNQQHIEEEFGDVLFSLVNFSRFLNIDADLALEKVNKKFIARFKKMEEVATAQGKHLTEMSLQEMDAIWNEVKKDIHC